MAENDAIKGDLELKQILIVDLPKSSDEYTERATTKREIIRRLRYIAETKKTEDIVDGGIDNKEIKREMIRYLSYREPQETKPPETETTKADDPLSVILSNLLLRLTLQEIFFSGYMPLTQKYLIDNSLFGNPFVEGHNHIAYLHGFIITMVLFVDIILRGIAQVYLCNHPITGLFICAGLALSSTKLLVYAIVGTSVSTLSCSILCLPGMNEVASGLCGYDGALIGCAVSVFIFQEDVTHMHGTDDNIAPSLSSKGMAITAILSAVSGVIHMSCRNMSTLPALTASFNICCLFLLFNMTDNRTTFSALSFSPPPAHDDDTLDEAVSSWAEWSFMFVYDASVRGVGQFMFADTTLGGWLVILGIGVASRYGALSSLLGSFVGCITARCILQVSPTHLVGVRNGLYGYNAAGTCCSFAGSVFYHSTGYSWVIGILAAGFTIFFQVGVEAILFHANELQLPSLTIPFVLSTWLVMISKSAWLDPLAEDGESFDDLRWKAHALGSELDLDEEEVNEVLAEVVTQRGIHRQESWNTREPGQMKRRSVIVKKLQSAVTWV
jgi:urea transporter